MLALFVGWKLAEEYKYYQVVKKEHQTFFFDEIGKTPDGRKITRAMFFNALLAETAKAQKNPPAPVRK